MSIHSHNIEFDTSKFSNDLISFLNLLSACWCMYIVNVIFESICINCYKNLLRGFSFSKLYSETVIVITRY